MILRRLNTYRFHAYLALLPYLSGSLLLIVIPAGATFYLAFNEYNGILPPQWVGLKKFQELIASPLVRLSIHNSFTFLILAVPLRLVGAFALALLLQWRGRLAPIQRAITYLPTIIPEVAYALLGLWFFNPVYGPLNILLNGLGLPAPDWLVQPETARLAIVIMAAFQIGEGFVVLLAGLQTIPRALYESAMVDGATGRDTFRHITLPLMLPWLLLLTFRDLLVSLQNTFTPSFVMTYGGPYYATMFIPLVIYELSFDFLDLGMAAALLVTTYILTSLLIVGLINLIGFSRDDLPT